MPRARNILPPAIATNGEVSPIARRSSRAISSKAVNYTVDLPSPSDPDVIDGKMSLCPSPTATEDHALSPPLTETETEDDIEELPKKKKGKAGSKKAKAAVSKPKPKPKPPSKKRKAGEALGEDGEFDPDAADSEEAAITRPPAVNDEYRPLPWKGRLGFACLNTYLRSSPNPVFCSRTCRIDTILKHDKETGAGAGLTYVKSLGFQNATDLSHLIRWNHKYNIKFLRISSEMFPFASHPIYGYDLAHAAEPLKEAGRLAMEYGHRLTMHPGQFTQLGSPRAEVVENAIRDLNFHCELLDRLQLKGQADKDAVMIIHMGGIFGDKGATLDRFRKVYTTRLSEGVKRRLVLENDDVCWTVDDLIETCETLNIPMVLDWHHNNILHGALREGTLDVKEIYGERIKNTWVKKGIKQKQHYSEPREGSVTNKERRRHSARVFDLPPCEDDMDLMIEAKDKEQAVFELMRKFKLEGWEKVGDVVPHERDDFGEEIEVEEVAMGGSGGKVYWPEGQEEVLKPKKRVRAKKEEGEDGAVKVVKKAKKKVVKKEVAESQEAEPQAVVTQSPKKPRKKASKKAMATTEVKVEEVVLNAVIPEPVEEEIEVPKPSRSKRVKKMADVKIEEVTEAPGRRRSGRAKK